MKKLMLTALAFVAFETQAMIGENEPESDSRVRKALTASDVKFRVDSDGDFRVTWTLEDDRTHMTIVNSNTETLDNMEMRDVWAIGYRGAPLTKPQLENLLIKNGTYKTGSWSLKKQKDGKVSVIFTITISARASGDSLKAATRIVAREADRLEKEMLGSDEL